MKKTLILSILPILAIICSCTQDKGEVKEPTFTQTELESVAPMNMFAIDALANAMSMGNGRSLVLSPLSLAVSLGMEANLQSENASDILEQLGQDNMDQVNALMNKVINKYNYPVSGIEKTLATAIFNDGTLDESSSQVKTYYLSDIYSCDFSKPSEVSSKVVDWVKSRTKGMIDLEAIAIPEGTKIIHTSAVYFNGQWSKKFDEKLTYDSDFHMENEEVKSVKMMSTSYEGLYSETENAKMAVMPYSGKKYQMVFIQTVDNQPLTYQIWTSLNSSLDNRQISLFVPRFEIEFKEEMDFGLKACNMLHCAKIIVNERGTQASASTITGDVSAGPLEPVEFTADRPFYFAIVDCDTDLIVFAGHFNG